MSSTFGKLFTVTTFGESHGAAVGCVIDGCPAGLSLACVDFAADMARRRPGYSVYASARREDDDVEILSGVFEGKTLGTPIALMIRNKGHNSADYDELRDVFRPSHADFAYQAKYGIRDHRGGGRASGRETAARVAAGVVAKKILAELGVAVNARVAAIGGIVNDSVDFAQNADIAALLADCLEKGDSVGSLAECRIIGLKSGIGAPVASKLSADLAAAMHSIGGVKGVEIGSGFAAADALGSLHNDPFTTHSGRISKTSNNAGGILGGISDGDEIVVRIAFKPPPSIGIPQPTIDAQGHPVEISVTGRHDPVIAPRACVVVEAMAAITLVDHILRGLGGGMDVVKKIYMRCLAKNSCKGS